MKVVLAVFTVEHKGVEYQVVFNDRRCQVVLEGQALTILDIGHWKPCATHAKSLVAMAVGARESGNHAKQRIEAAKPAAMFYDLKLYEAGTE